jgi:hypothetical protein
MKCLLALSIILPILSRGQTPIATATNDNNGGHEINYSTIGEIPLPAGFERIKVSQNSFEQYIRYIPIKKDKTIYLYTGQPKKDQQEQFAVLDISVGNKDLQQCADAIMRIRAEYFYSIKQFDKIRFADNAGLIYQLRENATRKDFDAYLENVFAHCGTLSLEKQLYKRSKMDEANIGDVLIKGGSPGHAMMIADMAINSKGQKIFLLLQGFMPAQSIHIVKDFRNTDYSPWYIVNNEASIITPDWDFQPSQIRHW